MCVWDCLDTQLNQSPDGGREMVSETSVTFNELARLVVREDFINVSSHETVRSYKKVLAPEEQASVTGPE
jgi:hypothetical protein